MKPAILLSIILTSVVSVSTPLVTMATPIVVRSAQGAPNAAEAEAIIKRLWKAIPDNGINDYTERGLTPEFYDLVKEGFDMPGTNPGGIGDEEIMWYWYTGQDSGNNDHISKIQFKTITADNISAKVLYVNLNEPNWHEIKLVKTADGWLIDDFDDMHQGIQDFVYTWRRNYIEGAANDNIRRAGKSLTAEEAADYRKEVAAYLDKYGSHKASGSVQEQVIVQEEPRKEARKIEPTPTSGQIFNVVEQPAEFPGGISALMQWLASNLRYPKEASKNNIQGRVIVKFVVHKDGSIGQVSVVRGVDKDLDAEAERVVKMMPKWQPGMNNGVPVNSYYTLPITFRI